MDKMLVRYILMILGVAIRSNSLSISTGLSSSKNDSSDSILDFKSIQGAKPKRQLDNFDFDVGSFEGSSFFKTEDTTSLDNLDAEDFSGFLPTSSKVARSNIDDLGTYGANFDSSSLSSENYQSDSEATEKNPNIHSDYYSNEDQSALSQSQLNTVNNQGTTPHYNNVSYQPKSGPIKPSPFLTEQRNLPVIQYNTYPSLAEYASGNPAYTPATQLPIQTVSPTHSITYAIPYKTQYSHSSRVYAPLHNHNQQQQSYGVPYQNAYNNIHLTTTPTVDINGKKLSLPILQLQTEVPSYVQSLKNPPHIFGAESGLQYKTQSGLGVSFDFAKLKNHNQRLGTNAPFVVTHNPRTAQLLPLKTSGSTAQFPQYKGASVSQFPSRGFQVIPNDYQEFKLQPQLHFSKNTNNKNNGYHSLNNYQKPGVYSNPSAQIKSDVEIIDKKKKKPPPPPKNDDNDEKDDDNSDEDYAGKDSYLPKEEDDDKSSRKRFKESELEGDFIPSKSYPFKEYDKKFSKSKKSRFNSDDDDGDDDHDDESNLATKYRYSAKSDDDEDDDDDSASKYENESSDDEPKSKYHSRPIHDSYKNHYEDENDDEESLDTKDKKNYLQRLERNNHGKKSRHSQKEHRSNNQGKYGRLHGDKYHKPTEFDANHSKSHSTQRRPIDSMKNKYRAYRDESGEPSTRQISSSFLPNNANMNAWPTEQINVLSQIKNSNIEVPKTIWKNSYGTRVDDPDDESNTSSYSQEVAAAMNKHPKPRSPVTTTQEYTTRPAHKTSTILSKGLAYSNSSKTTESPLRPRSTRNREEKQKFNPSTDNRSFSTGVKGLVHSTEKNFNFGFH